MTASSPSAQKEVARVAGFWYLFMAVAGVLGFMVLHPQIYSDDPQETLQNLVDKEQLARLRLLMEILIVLTQALTAWWFYRLFRSINPWAAWATGLWGTVNAVLITISAVAMAMALHFAQSDWPADHQLLIIALLAKLSKQVWALGGLFFGLWLVPLGYIIVQSKRLPLWLGRTLILGGIGYLLATVLPILGVTGGWTDYLSLPASVGEFWLIGYLLIYGIRPE